MDVFMELRSLLDNVRILLSGRDGSREVDVLLVASNRISARVPSDMVNICECPLASSWITSQRGCQALTKMVSSQDGVSNGNPTEMLHYRCTGQT